VIESFVGGRAVIAVCMCDLPHSAHCCQRSQCFGPSNRSEVIYLSCDGRGVADCVGRPRVATVLVQPVFQETDGSQEVVALQQESAEE
jgi:hypothetical protein